jgi:hypothetical protein
VWHQASIAAPISEDGRAVIRLRAVGGTVWLTQAEIAALFDTTLQNVSLHLKNIFENNELDPASVLKESLITAAEAVDAEREADEDMTRLEAEARRLKKSDRPT